MITYIDDILIPTYTVSGNLDILKQVLILLKRYDFCLNLEKCAFVKTTIEYLGYIVSPSNITLSSRHTQAVADFPIPKKTVELQRFLGLANYCRRFIEDFSNKAKSLQSLLRKDTKFLFNEECLTALESLKKELISSPILRLYNPNLETELHTDAISMAVAGILLQKQANNL